MAKIIFILDDGEKVEVPVSGDMTIGRVEGNDVVVDDPRISGRHAELKYLESGTYELRDLASKAGTFVNGERIEVRKLASGDKIMFGPLNGEFETDGQEPTMIAPSPPAENDATTKARKAKQGKITKKEKYKPKSKVVRPTGGDVDQMAAAMKETMAMGKPPLPSSAPPSASITAPAPAAAAPAPVPAASSPLPPLPSSPPPAPAPASQSATNTGKVTGSLALPPKPSDPPKENSAPPPAQPAEEERLVADSFAKLEAEAKEDIEKLNESKQLLQDEVEKLRAELSLLKPEHADMAQRCTEMKSAVAGEERRMENLRAQITAGEQQFRDITGQIHSGTERIAALKGEEKRLSQVTEGLKDAEAKHADWITAIGVLAADYEVKSADSVAKGAEVERLSASAEKALRELEAMTANKEQMSVQLLSLLKDQETQEARVAEVRRQLTDVETRYQSTQQLADAREDQVKSAERKLQNLDQQRQTAEQRLKELGETESKLTTARAALQESETRQAALTAALALLATRQKSGEDQVSALDTRLLEMRQEQTASENRVAEARKELAAGERDLAEYNSRSEATRQKLDAERAGLEAQITRKQSDLAEETRKLDTTKAERAELERQCGELADTGKKLADTKAELATAEGLRTELNTQLADLETHRTAVQKIVDGLNHDEEATKGRLEVLRGREKDLRTQLDELKERERIERDKFEEIQGLSTEAEKEHKARMDEMLRTTDLTRRELAEMEMKLAPLREWKEAMDKRYARLASLPEDSTEARELFKEIEAEKNALRNLINDPAKGSSRSISLSESVLRANAEDADTDTADDEAPAEAASTPGKLGRPAGKRGRLHAPAPILDAETPQERAQVGHTGTGAMLSGTGQEMALKARLTRLRESVQREAARLEFLRQERAREESRGKAGAGPGDSMLREQERQLENKVRREEEKLAALDRKLENAEMEEEKRRERIAEAERKLSELKADIAEHERDRSDALHAAQLARKELGSIEEAVERFRTMGDAEPFDGRKTGSVMVGGSKLKTLVSGTPEPSVGVLPDGSKG